MLLPPGRAVRKLVAVAIKAHRIDPALHRALTEQIPRVGRLEKAETFNRQNHALFRAYLERHRDEIRVVDLELAAFVCVTSIEALTHTAVLHQKLVSDEATEALVDEATRLVVGSDGLTQAEQARGFSPCRRSRRSSSRSSLPSALEPSGKSSTGSCGR
jgi:hypothetical protein